MLGFMFYQLPYLRLIDQTMDNSQKLIWRHWQALRVINIIVAHCALPYQITSLDPRLKDNWGPQ